MRAWHAHVVCVLLIGGALLTEGAGTGEHGSGAQPGNQATRHAHRALLPQSVDGAHARGRAAREGTEADDIGTWSAADGAFLAVCVAVKDRGEDIREWVDYHAALGVGKFYIFETDNPEPVEWALEDVIAAGLVDYFSLPHVTPRTIPLMQIRIYNLCIQHVRHRHAFLAFFDVDEFLVLTGGPRASLRALLEEYREQAGLVVNWRLMGSGGHIIRPDAGTLRSYQTCTPAGFHENRHVKSIVNTRFVAAPSTDPHHFDYRGGRVAVNTAGERVGGPAAESVRWERIALYHYALKSQEEYRRKMRRGSAMGNYKGMTFFTRIDAAASEACTAAYQTCRGLGLDWCTDDPEHMSALAGIGNSVA